MKTVLAKTLEALGIDTQMVFDILIRYAAGE